MKTICIFTGFYLPHLGGVEKYTDKLSQELYKLGYKIIIVASNDNNYKLEEDLDYCHIYRLPVHNLFKNRYPLLKKNKDYKYVINKIKSLDIDYFICNTRFYFTSTLCCKLANEKKKKVVVVDHSSGHLSVGNKILDFFGRIYEHMITNKIKSYKPLFYGVSNRCNEWLNHFNISASGVFYNSIDGKIYDQYKNSEYKRDFKDKIVITFVGRIIKEKGIYLILDAFKNLEKKYNNIVLVVAGDGPILNKIKDEYKDDNIIFEGKINYDEVMSLFNRADIFVSPSLYPEGLPTTILEAGIMKCAIVATDRGGTVEVIHDDKLGIIMEETEESLENNLEKLINDSGLLNQFKENIHKRVKENFTWEIAAKNVEKELEENE